MTHDPIDFRAIKNQVSISRVLTHYGIELHSRGGELRGQCPLPTHTSNNSQDSFSVNVARNLWCCQSISCMDARGGKLGGTVLDLVASMERCSVRDAAERLHDWFGTESPEIPPFAPPAPPLNLPLRFQLRGIDHQHPYLQARGIRPATARAFGAGYYGGPGLLHGRVVIPIRNDRHELIAYAGRSLNGEEPKYRLPPGFHKSQVLFNLNRARDAGSETVVVVEGFFDAIKVHQAGYRNVVGLMGSNLSGDQASLLQNCFRRVVLMLDGDEAGQRAAKAMSERLAGALVEVDVIPLKQGQQPDQMDSRELDHLLGDRVRESRGMSR